MEVAKNRSKQTANFMEEFRFCRFRIRKNMWWTCYRSMEDDKEKLSALGDRLSATMQSITSNFRLGFGSFVDKVVMPYVSTVPRK